jgi:hypothetical protein
MTWIKTETPRDNPALGEILQAQQALYPDEYRGERRGERRLHPLVANDSIVLSHSLIPEALRHSFAAFGAMMAPNLPLSRRDHEMIAATVSALNRCFY